MPLDGLTLSFVADELNRLLAGGRIDKVTQPERDEILLTVRNEGKNYTLLLSASADCARANITQIKKNNPLEPPMLCMLMRKHIVGGRIENIEQINADRILDITIGHFDELGEKTTKRVICEFMGRYSNIIFVTESGKIIDSAKRVNEQMSSVREVLPGLRYERPPEHGKIPFNGVEPDRLALALSGFGGALKSAISKSISGMSRQTAAELAYRAVGNEDAYIEEIDVNAAAVSICEALKRIRLDVKPSVLTNSEGAAIDITAFDYLSRHTLNKTEFLTISEALDEFYRVKDMSERIGQKSAAIHNVLKNNIERCEKKLALQRDALLGAQKMDEYKRYGELITASQHLIKKGMKKAELPDYYQDGMPTVTVPIDEKLSPAQNAQRYFKLYQKARSAKILAAEQIEKTSEELDYLEGQMENLGKCEAESELFELRSELEKFGYVRANHNRRQMKQLPPSSPMKFMSKSGAVIFVGKNNLQNDKLTASAEPDETWLHAKNMPGSHVIIASASIDDETLLMAARLAAKYSKGANGTNVPIDYTLRKYVKKPSGAKPGFVIYTHQHTLYVDPYTEEELCQLK